MGWDVYIWDHPPRWMGATKNAHVKNESGMWANANAGELGREGERLGSTPVSVT